MSARVKLAAKQLAFHLRQGADGPEPEREVAEEELETLRGLAASVQAQYAPLDHEGLFAEIHAAFFPGQPFVPTGPCWQSIGFQSTEPTRDLRGSGVLGLKQLTYFVRVYPGRAVAMRQRQWELRAQADSDADDDNEPVARTYPWAAVGINITRMICELFSVLSPYGAPGGFETARCGFWPLLRDEFFVDELYCAVFEQVDRLFTSRELGYMDFPALLAEIRSATLHELCRCCDSHTLSIHRDNGYYHSRLPLESVRLGLGLPSALSASATCELLPW